MPMLAEALPAIISAGGAIAGSALGNRGSTVNSTQNINQKQDVNQTATTTPNLSPQLQDLMNSLLGITKGYVGSSPDLTGYAANAGQGINQTSDINKRIIQQTLAARGLTYSPLAGSELINNEMDRTGKLAQLGGSLPLLKRQLTDSALSTGSNIFKTFPFGQTVTGNQQSNITGTNTGSVTAPGNILGGLFTGLGASGGMIGNILSKLGIGGGSGGTSPGYLGID